MFIPFTVITMDKILLSTFLISLLVAISGNLAVFRKASFLITSVAHSALAGVALSLLLSSFGIQQDYFLLATIFAIAFAILASLTSKFSDIDTGIAISFALSMSLAVIFLSQIRGMSAKIWSFLFGDLFLITEQDLLYLTFSSISIVLIFGLLYEKLLLFLFDPEGARVSGINPKLFDAIIVTIIAISVVAVIRSVGAILAYSIFIAPSAIAKEFARSVKQSLIITFVIAMISLMTGIFTSLILPISASALSAFIASTLYLVIFYIKIYKK
ncbi:MAG: metal ABC transporter permease [Archaeoglobaceae archaeon]|nr:metal ABC transporter permease [Archaeoglobaceae archaeon]MDW8127681.1 metal ABC transporter permease [Archaeoglobaceae archaeon]